MGNLAEEGAASNVLFRRMNGMGETVKEMKSYFKVREVEQQSKPRRGGKVRSRKLEGGGEWGAVERRSRETKRCTRQLLGS